MFLFKKNKLMQGELIMACGCCSTTKKVVKKKTVKKKATKKK